MTVKTDKDYFIDEMRLLADRAKIFASKYPQQARALSLDNLNEYDPWVERLLEGVAYLTGQVKQQVDFGIDYLTQAMLMQLAPESLRDFPSQSLCQFSPDMLQKATVLKKNTLLKTKPLGDEQTECVFSTVSDLLINPLELSQCQVVNDSELGWCLQLDLNIINQAGFLDLDLDRLCFHLVGEKNTVQYLYWVMLQQVSGIWVQASKQYYNIGKANDLIGGIDTFWQVLSGEVDNKFKAMSLLQQYFLNDECLYSIQLPKIDTSTFSNSCNSFKVLFQLDCQLDTSIGELKNIFKLHCVNAINAYSANIEPININTEKLEYPLYLKHNKLDSIGLYKLTQCVGMDSRSNKTVEMDDFYARKTKNIAAHHYCLKKSVGNDVYFVAFSGDLSLFNTAVCTAVLTNKTYPRTYVGINELHFSQSGDINDLCLTYSSRPSKFYAAIAKSDYYNQVINNFNWRTSSIETIDDLTLLLNNFDSRGIYIERINALQGLTIETKNSLLKGCFYRVMTVTVDVNLHAFFSVHELYVFGCVLFAMFNHYRELNTIVDFSLNYDEGCFSWLGEVQ